MTGVRGLATLLRRLTQPGIVARIDAPATGAMGGTSATSMPAAQRRPTPPWLTALWNWHEQPRLVALAATAAGRVAIALIAAALVPRYTAMVVAPALLLFALLPARRIEILAAAGALALALKLPPPVREAGALPALLAMVALVAVAYAVFRAARDFARLPTWARNHPQLLLHGLLLGLAGALALAARPGGWLGAGTLHWAATGLVPLLLFVLWRAGYVLQAGRGGSARRTRFIDHWFYLLPAWGGSMVPYGKGHDYLMQCRAEGREAIAASQLAGLKLLLLAIAWQGASALLQAVVHGGPLPAWAASVAPASLGWPSLAALIASGPSAAPLGVRWAVLPIELMEVTLKIAAMGHLIVGLLRLFGFRVFRNTYRPLLATSIVEFWNRLYYYFKELLVQFFFFPAYLRWFRHNPRLRIFTAVMLSAGIGNLYFHVVRDFHFYAGASLQAGADMLASRAFYCLLLGLGIFASMLREQQRRGKKAPASRWTPVVNARRIAGVWLFYSLIHIWNAGSLKLDFAARTGFFLGLFGLG